MMPNSNYLKGRRMEYKRKKHWEGMGYTVLRTAGSHGLFDLIAIRLNGPTTFIQCKVTDTESKADKLNEDFAAHPPLTPCRYYHQCLEVKHKGGWVSQVFR